MYAPAIRFYWAGSILCRLFASLSWRARALCGCTQPPPVLLCSCIVLLCARASLLWKAFISKMLLLQILLQWIDMCACCHQGLWAAVSSQPPQPRLLANIWLVTSLKMASPCFNLHFFYCVMKLLLKCLRTIYIYIYICIYIYIYFWELFMGLLIFLLSCWFSFALIYLCRFHTQHGAWTHDPEIKSLILPWLSQPGILLFHWSLNISLYIC